MTRVWRLAADRARKPRPLAGHKVLPQHAVQYQQLIEDYYKGIHESPDFDARLIGSWEIVVGEVDTFVHIFGYEGIAGFEKTKYEIRASKVCPLFACIGVAVRIDWAGCQLLHIEPDSKKLSLRQGHLQFFNKEILPLIQSRTSQVRRGGSP